MDLFIYFFFCRETIPTELLLDVKQAGFSDKQIADNLDTTEAEIRTMREGRNIKPWSKQVIHLVGHSFDVSRHSLLPVEYYS